MSDNNPTANIDPNQGEYKHTIKYSFERTQEAKKDRAIAIVVSPEANNKNSKLMQSLNNALLSEGFTHREYQDVPPERQTVLDSGERAPKYDITKHNDVMNLSSVNDLLDKKNDIQQLAETNYRQQHRLAANTDVSVAPYLLIDSSLIPGLKQRKPNQEIINQRNAIYSQYDNEEISNDVFDKQIQTLDAQVQAIENETRAQNVNTVNAFVNELRQTYTDSPIIVFDTIEVSISNDPNKFLINRIELPEKSKRFQYGVINANPGASKIINIDIPLEAAEDAVRDDLHEISIHGRTDNIQQELF